MSNNSWFMKLKDVNNNEYVLLNNGKLFMVGRRKTITLPPKLMMSLKQLYSKYYSFLKKEKYLKGTNGKFIIKFKDMNESLTIKTQGSFENEQAIKQLITYYLAPYLILS